MEEEQNMGSRNRNDAWVMSRRSFLERGALVAGTLAGTPLAATPLATTGVHAASQRRSPGSARTAGQDAAGVSDFGVPLPADAAPKEYQFVQTTQPSSGLGWKSMDPLESIYSSFPGYANLG